MCFFVLRFLHMINNFYWKPKTPLVLSVSFSFDGWKKCARAQRVTHIIPNCFVSSRTWPISKEKTAEKKYSEYSDEKIAYPVAFDMLTFAFSK